MILKFVEEKDVIFLSEKLMDLGLLQKIVNKGTKGEVKDLANNLSKGMYYIKPYEPTVDNAVVIYSLSLIDLTGEGEYKFLETKKTFELLPSTVFSDKRKELHSKSTWLEQVSGYVTFISPEELERFFVL